MNKKIQLIPVMLCFFAMGFVDLVGIASNYVQSDLGLSDAAANIFPSLVFFWFLIFSVPTGMLMNRIGRKNTVLLSLVVTVVSLLLPIFGESYGLMLVSFSLLGIGNALMQTSLNPLITNIIKGDRLASTMTFGQFVKAIASFMAPYIAMWGATAAMPTFGLGWRVLFPVYMAIGILASLLLLLSPIEREAAPDKASSFADCFKLLGKPVVLLSFLGIMCHVGIDVGTNTTAPKLLMERVGMTLTEAGFATSLYFIFRTVGCLSGSFILAKFSHRKFFLVSVVMMALAMVGMEAERGVGPDDHGPVRRYGVPAPDGIRLRRGGPGRRRGGDGRRRRVSVVLYDYHAQIIWESTLSVSVKRCGMCFPRERNWAARPPISPIMPGSSAWKASP